MRKTISVLLAAGAVVAPTAALAAPPIVGHHHARNVARQQCTSARHLLGVTGFRLKYGGYVSCVRSQLPTNVQAAATCRAERQQIGARAFRLKYGGPVGLNRCIKVLTAG